MAKKKLKKNFKITKEEIRQLKKAPVRKLKKEAGALDGRFNTRAEEDKTKYKRKPKHKDNGEDL